MKQRLELPSGFGQAVAQRWSGMSRTGLLCRVGCRGILPHPPTVPSWASAVEEPLPSGVMQNPPVMGSTWQPWVSFPAVVSLDVNYT